MARVQGRFSSLAALGLVLLVAGPAVAQVVPGTGRRVSGFGDDFEDPGWSYKLNGKKSSMEQDGRIRFPKGKSRNGRWEESTKRGHPDYVKRVSTPAGGLPGSKGALLLQSRDTGIPGRPSGRMMQDDFLASSNPVNAGSNPNYVVRVYVPPFDQFENRSGSTFGFRLGCRTKDKPQKRNRNRNLFEIIRLGNEEAYWPGMFVQFQSKDDPKYSRDKAFIVCRAGRTGKEFPGLELTPGWWTLGLSCTADGSIHYYASPGVDRLTANDRIGSSYPYNFHAERVVTMFFNICSADDGKTWSTPWVVDDPAMYVTGGGLGQFLEVRGDDDSRRRSGGLFKKLFR